MAGIPATVPVSRASASCQGSDEWTWLLEAGTRDDLRGREEEDHMFAQGLLKVRPALQE